MSTKLERVSDVVDFIGRFAAMLLTMLLSGFLVYVFVDLANNTPFTERYELERTACYDLQADMRTALTPEEVGLLVHGRGQTCRSLVNHER